MQAALAVNNRLYDKLHEDRPWHDGREVVWAKEFSRLTPWHARDGVSIWVSRYDLTPDDMFLGDQGQAPAVDPDKQDPGAGSNQPGA